MSGSRCLRRLRNFLHGGRPGSLIDSDLHRIIFINCAAVVGGLYLLIYSALAVAMGKPVLAAALGAGCAVALGVVLWLRYGGAVGSVASAVLWVYIALLMFSSVFDGGVTGGAPTACSCCRCSRCS